MSTEPKKDKAKFSAEEELRLIYEVERRPILWDTTNELYRRADLKPQVWSEVAANVGPAHSGDAVSARFTSLRDTYSKNWRKVQDSRTSGSGTDDVYTPKWNLYQNLKFLQKTCSHQGSLSNVQMPKAESQPSVIDQGVHYYDENLKQFMEIPHDESVQSFNSTSSVNEMIPSSCSSGPSSPDFFPPRPASAPIHHSSSKRKSEAEDLFPKRCSTKKTGAVMMEEAVKVMKDICQQQPPLPTDSFPKADREEIFGNYVASRLRLLTDENKKQCENALMAVLMNY